MTACLKLEGISPLLVVIPSQIRSCLTTCMTTRALARLHVLSIPHTSPLLPRRASAVLVESQGSRNHTTQPPLQSTTDHHRPMTSFTLPSDHWAPVRTACHSLFPLNRLRFSGSLHRSPSIQLHLQHDSMVVVRATPRPVDSKLSCASS